VKNSILPGHFKRLFDGYIDDSVVVAGGEADLYLAIRGKDSVSITKDSNLFGGHLLETVLVPSKDRKLYTLFESESIAKKLKLSNNSVKLLAAMQKNNYFKGFHGFGPVKTYDALVKVQGQFKGDFNPQEVFN
jgi:hypothetical protein